MEKTKRDMWLDGAKGLGMVLVVMGHAYNPTHFLMYIYWFHMPFFFLFSGYVTKEIQPDSLKQSMTKRARGLLLPYAMYMLLFTVIRYIQEVFKGNLSLDWYVTDVGKLLFGGRFITGYYGVFWFITCLLFTQVIFMALCKWVPKKKWQFLIILSLYVIAHLEGSVVRMIGGQDPSLQIFVPWNLDVVMISLFYYSIGYYGKKYLKKIPVWLTSASVLLTGFFIFLQEKRVINYHLSLKYVRYNHLVLDIVIPLVMILAFAGIFQLIQKSKLNDFFVFINKRSTTIMYLHIGVNKLLLLVFDYGNVAYTLIGVGVPLLLALTWEQGEIWKNTLQRKRELSY